MKIDLPHSSFHGYSYQITHTLQLPENGKYDHEEEVEEEEVHDSFSKVEDNSTCVEEGDALAGGSWHGERRKVLLVRQSCGRILDSVLGLKTGYMKQWVVSQHAAALSSYGYLKKRERITGFRVMISWKNPGRLNYHSYHITLEKLKTKINKK